MEKFTQKEIKHFLSVPGVINATNFGIEEYEAVSEKEHGFECVGLSHGKYGMNGGVFRGRETGTFYVVTARSTAIFIFT